MEFSEKSALTKKTFPESSEAKKLKALIEHSDVMLWSVIEEGNGDTFYEQVNEAYASSNGKIPEDYNGKNFKDVHSEKEIKEIKSHLERAKKIKVHNFHREELLKGQKKYYILRIICVTGEGSRYYYIGSAVDVSELVQAEEKLLKTEKKYLDLVKYAPIAITRVSVETDKFEFVNDEFTKLSGYTLDEYNSLSRDEYLNLIFDEDRNILIKKYDEWKHNDYKGIFRHEYRFITKPKKIKWLEVYFHGEVDEDGKIRTINQMYVDITDRKLSQEKEILLAHAVESTTEMICITDLNNRLTFVNKTFLDTYGYSMDELSGKDISFVGSSKNPQDIHVDICESTQLGGWKGTLWNRAKNGREFPVQLSTSRIFDSNNKVIGFIGVARDITERLKAEENLKHMLKEKEILLKEVYHRVKNNLQVVNSLLNLQSQTVKDKESKEMFKEARNRIKLMSGIHEKLYRTKDLTRVDFSGYIKELTATLKEAYPVISGHVDLNIESNNIYLGVDKAIPCGLIINELVSNSYKYAFEGRDNGSIFIKLYLDESGSYVLEVGDNGIGIADSYDIKDSDTLGMTLVLTLTEQLSGELEIVKNNGLKFIIKFK